MTNLERATELINKVQADTIEYIDRRIAALEDEWAVANTKANTARNALRRTPIESYVEGNAIATKAHVEKWLQDRYMADHLSREAAHVLGRLYELRHLRVILTRNS